MFFTLFYLDFTAASVLYPRNLKKFMKRYITVFSPVHIGYATRTAPSQYARSLYKSRSWRILGRLQLPFVCDPSFRIPLRTTDFRTVFVRILEF